MWWYEQTEPSLPCAHSYSRVTVQTLQRALLLFLVLFRVIDCSSTTELISTSSCYTLYLTESCNHRIQKCIPVLNKNANLSSITLEEAEYGLHSVDAPNQRVKQMLTISSSPSAKREQHQMWYSANEVLKLLGSSKWQWEDICIDPCYTTKGNPFLTSVEHNIQKSQTRSWCSTERANTTLLERSKYWSEKQISEGTNQAVPPDTMHKPLVEFYKVTGTPWACNRAITTSTKIDLCSSWARLATRLQGFRNNIYGEKY